VVISEWLAVHFSRRVTAVRLVRISEAVRDLGESGSKMLNNPRGETKLFTVSFEHGPINTLRYYQLPVRQSAEAESRGIKLKCNVSE